MSAASAEERPRCTPGNRCATCRLERTWTVGPVRLHVYPTYKSEHYRWPGEAAISWHVTAQVDGWHATRVERAPADAVAAAEALAAKWGAR